MKYKAKHEIIYQGEEGRPAKTVPNVILTEAAEKALGKEQIKTLVARGALIEVNDDGSRIQASTDEKVTKAEAKGQKPRKQSQAASKEAVKAGEAAAENANAGEATAAADPGTAAADVAGDSTTSATNRASGTTTVGSKK